MSDSLKSRPASVGDAWSDLGLHGGAIALTFLSLLALGGISYIIFYLLFFIFFSVAGGASSDSAPLLGLVVGGLGAFPTYVLSCLAGVLFMAIPALYFSSGTPVSFPDAVRVLMKRPKRYLWAGFVFTLISGLGGALCYVPGIAVALTGPVYVNLIFNTDRPVFDAFGASFSATYQGQGWSFVGAEVLGGILAMIVAVCTCGFGGFIVFPMFCFYLQNLIYNKGLVSQ